MKTVRIIAAAALIGAALGGVSACDYSGPSCVQGHYDYWMHTHYYSSGSGKYRRSGSYTTLDPYWVCDRYAPATANK